MRVSPSEARLRSSGATREPRADAPPARIRRAALSVSGESDARRTAASAARCSPVLLERGGFPRGELDDGARTRGTREVPSGRLTLQKLILIARAIPRLHGARRHATRSGRFVGRQRETRKSGRRPESIPWVRAVSRGPPMVGSRLVRHAGAGLAPTARSTRERGRQRHAVRRARGRNDACHRTERRSGPPPCNGGPRVAWEMRFGVSRDEGARR